MTSGQPSISIVLPYYNEIDYLPATLECLLAQDSQPDQVVLIDNGSTDGSTDLGRMLLKRSHLRVEFVDEVRPGKLYALQTGCRASLSEWIAFWDADTYYPNHYLSLARRVFQSAGEELVALMAVPLQQTAGSIRSRWRRCSYPARSRVLPKQIFTGGYGQIVRSDVVRRVGGVSDCWWKYVLLDHEFMHRVLHWGRLSYHPDLWCETSPRRGDRRMVRWTLMERMLYHCVPFCCKDWFFYRFLATRFARRDLTHLRLRQRDWV